jgi:hypothetical protein
MTEDPFVDACALVSDQFRREYQRRLDCEFLGIDPDHVPTRAERARAWLRAWTSLFASEGAGTSRP